MSIFFIRRQIQHFPIRRIGLISTIRSSSASWEPNQNEYKQNLSVHSIRRHVGNKTKENHVLTIAERMVNELPSPLIKYAELMRLNKPTGTWLLLWPCYWSIGLSTPAGCMPSLNLLTLFAVGAISLRSAGCIINDMWDQKFDSKVERTKNRPIASKQITNFDAAILMQGLLAIGLLVILKFDLNSIMLAMSSMILVVVYPAMKRISNYPQLILGMAFNWGALLGWSVACNGQLDLTVTLPLYLGGICWTMIYDTLYAHQDKHDDQKLGLKSTALTFGQHTSNYLYAFTAAMTTSMTLAGFNSDQCWPYYLSVLLCSTNLVRIIKKTDINNIEQCQKAFNQNKHIGWMLFAGIVFGTLFKRSTECDDENNVETETINNNISPLKINVNGKLPTQTKNVNF